MQLFELSRQVCDLSHSPLRPRPPPPTCRCWTLGWMICRPTTKTATCGSWSPPRWLRSTLSLSLFRTRARSFSFSISCVCVCVCVLFCFLSASGCLSLSLTHTHTHTLSLSPSKIFLAPCWLCFLVRQGAVGTPSHAPRCFSVATPPVGFLAAPVGSFPPFLFHEFLSPMPLLSFFFYPVCEQSV